MQLGDASIAAPFTAKGIDNKLEHREEKYTMDMVGDVAERKGIQERHLLCCTCVHSYDHMEREQHEKEAQRESRTNVMDLRRRKKAYLQS